VGNRVGKIRIARDQGLQLARLAVRQKAALMSPPKPANAARYLQSICVPSGQNPKRFRHSGCWSPQETGCSLKNRYSRDDTRSPDY
jgi:hypothetical protein